MYIYWRIDVLFSNFYSVIPQKQNIWLVVDLLHKLHLKTLHNFV